MTKNELEPSRRSVAVGVAVFLVLLALPSIALIHSIRDDSSSIHQRSMGDARHRPRAFLSAGATKVEGSGGLGCWAITEEPVDGDVVGVTSSEEGIVGVTCADGTPGYLGKVLTVQAGERLTVSFDRSDAPKRLRVVIDEHEPPILIDPANPASFEAPTMPGRHYIGVSNDWPQGDTWHGFKIDVA